MSVKARNWPICCLLLSVFGKKRACPLLGMPMIYSHCGDHGSCHTCQGPPSDAATMVPRVVSRQAT